MTKKILIIGGTRLFGRVLVEHCLTAGHDVTLATRGRAADPFGARVHRIVVDRSDRPAMTTAFATATYDLIYDQVCYTAHDAAIAADVFAGRTPRYMMASTIEVYRPRLGRAAAPFDEDDIDLAITDDDAYGTGKRQAEAILAAALPAVRVRIGHVLAGPEDFTGRLAHYVDLVRRGAPLHHATTCAPTSFIGLAEISALLAWLGDIPFIGALNAAHHTWTAVDLHHRIAAVLALPAHLAPAPSTTPNQLSPFDYPAPYTMRTARLHALGHRPALSTDWLDDAIRRHAEAQRNEAIHPEGDDAR